MAIEMRGEEFDGLGAAPLAALKAKIAPRIMAARQAAAAPASSAPATAAAPIWKNPLVLGGVALAALFLLSKKKRKA